VAEAGETYESCYPGIRVFEKSHWSLDHDLPKERVSTRADTQIILSWRYMTYVSRRLKLVVPWQTLKGLGHVIS
jgi:hypothetical protein